MHLCSSVHADNWLDVSANVPMSSELLSRLTSCCCSAKHLLRMQVLAEWCKQTDALLAESEAGAATSLSDESGPDTELEFWRVRMAKFNSVTEQMKSKECRLVMGVCSTARSKQYKHWKEVDVKVSACIEVSLLLPATQASHGRSIQRCRTLLIALWLRLGRLLCHAALACCCFQPAASLQITGFWQFYYLRWELSDSALSSLIVLLICHLLCRSLMLLMKPRIMLSTWPPWRRVWSQCTWGPLTQYKTPSPH